MGQCSRSDVALLAEVISGSDRAWRRFIKQYELSAAQDRARVHRTRSIRSTPAQLDDVMGDFWLRMVDDDRRWLRRFRGGGTSLEAFLRLHALEVAQQHLRRLVDEPVTVPLDEAHDVPVVRESRAAVRPHSDLTGLAALLQLPIEMQALRSDVNQLRAALDQLRRALPPALLSVGDAARALNVSTVTIRRMIRAGRLAHVRAGRSLRVDLTRTPVESTNIEDGIRAAAGLSRRRCNSVALVITHL